MQKPRKSSPGAKVGPTPAQQEQIFQAAAAGISITQDASQAVAKFLTAAIAALQTNMQTILQPNDATDPPGEFMRAMTGLMIKQLTERVTETAPNNPGYAEAANARAGRSTAADGSYGATARGATKPKARRPRLRRSKRRPS